MFTKKYELIELSGMDRDEFTAVLYRVCGKNQDVAKRASSLIYERRLYETALKAENRFLREENEKIINAIAKRNRDADDSEKGCDLCNNPTTKFNVWARGSIASGVLSGALFENHFEPAFCPVCGKALRNNESATKGA